MPPVSAPYRFIPITPNLVIPPPVPLEDLSFDTPLSRGSVSARIKIVWTAKTPVCVGDNEGGDDTAREVTPLRVGGRYCLPGPSLRGMLRNTVAIATFSHLGRINSHRHESHRDFTGLPGSDYHQIKVAGQGATKVYGGWLSWEEDRKAWILRPAGSGSFYRVGIDDLLDKIHQTDGNDTLNRTDWLIKDAAEKYDLVQTCLPSAGRLPVRIVDAPNRKTGFQSPWPKLPVTWGERGNVSFVQLAKGSTAKALQVICTGPMAEENITSQAQTAPKATECLFALPGKQEIEIPKSWMEVFHQFNADPSRDGGNPKGIWRDWLRAKNWHQITPGFEEKRDDRETFPQVMTDAPGIPVFYTNGTEDFDLSQPLDGTLSPGRQTFWFSLSRVFRMPHAYGVGEVARRLYTTDQPGDTTERTYDVPRLTNPLGWDFARALFGEVDGANRDSREDDRDAQADGTKREQALKGRVAVGFAWAPQGTKPESQTKSGVFGQPRESFWPFYLRDRDNPDRGGSYSSASAIPAGRKRTYARTRPDSQWPQGNGNENTLSTLRFLPVGTRFEGEIRVHNLAPAEFGALLWAITFGPDEGHKRCHQIGRAKGLGHGVIHPEISFAAPVRVHQCDPLPEGDPQNPKTWIQAFVDYMDQALDERDEAPYLDQQAIRMLQAMATPERGDQLAARLKTGELPDFASWRPETKEIISGNWTCPYPFPVNDEI
ncbi:TIGR03986 family CRISPR-associated RAMP protein [Rhodospirillum sp. A1_3_36]|uniref:TIGR03986 family type III CRISPR-associated RAMP protein n=1 Tax=Rhodospirillum sp. A1_3_36 TaxID=3391666 RepID=UPI0039A4A60C